MGRFVDLSGCKFGRLTVLCRTTDHICKSGQHKTMWLCKCNCGNETVVSAQGLRSGRTQSCGCYLLDVITKHGGTSRNKNKRDRLYKVWEDMKRRCYNENDSEYHNYGGRGIVVCNEWLHDYSSFRDWAYASGYDDSAKKGQCTLDRINVDLNYSPENCRWITHKQQQNNTTRSVKIEFNGESHTASEWEDITGIKKEIIYGRIFKYNWPIEKALTTPLMQRYVRHKKESDIVGASTQSK